MKNKSVIPEEARRMALLELIDSDIKKIKPTIRAVYDYAAGVPILGRLAVKKKEIKKKGEEPLTIWVPEWVPAEPVSTDYKLVQPDQNPDGLLHYPEYRKNIRKANLSQAFLYIKQRITENIGLENDDDANALVAWIIAAHFSAIFEHFPILDFYKAGYNSGGSVAFTTTMTYCPRPWIVQSPTEAALFRYADALRPTIGIEEFTPEMKQEVRDAILTLLDGAFDKNRKIPRTGKNGSVVMFDLFGPKVIVDPQSSISRYSTASRTLFIRLTNKKMQSNPERLKEEDKEFIQTLYDLYIVYAHKIKRAYENCHITESGRLDQAFRPLVAVALVLKSEGIDVVDSIMRVIQQQYENLEILKTAGDITKQILFAIYDIVSDENTKLFREGEKGIRYIRLSYLNSQLLNRLGTEFQTDTSSNRDVRYWKRAPEELAKVLNDPKRLASMLRTFLPEYIGNAEPGSRNLCLYYKDKPDSLKARIMEIIGYESNNESDIASYKSYKILQVGLDTEPVFSNLINNKYIKKSYITTYKHKIERRKNRKKIYSIPPECRNLPEFLFADLENTDLVTNSTCRINIGNVGDDTGGGTSTGKIAENDKEFSTWRYFRILENFSLDFNGKIYTFTKDHISKFPVSKASIYEAQGLIKRVCPDNYIWDPVSKDCILLEVSEK